MSRKKWEMPKGSGRSASGFGKPLAIGIGISMALTLISGLIPSRSAAKKDPVVALRTE